MQSSDKVKVWDPLVRIVHWAVVVGFFTAYATGEEAPPLHEWMGYAVLVLAIVRIIWGFAGSGHARFSDFVRGPGAVLTNLRDIVTFRAKRHLGHSPAGGAMVVLLLVMLTATSVTGIIGDREMEQGAPAATMTEEHQENDDGEHRGEEGPITELHEVLANVTLALVLLHIFGVILASFSHRENLVAAMFTGRKRP